MKDRVEARHALGVRAGDLLCALGVFKLVVGVIVYRDALAAVAREGIVARVTDLDVRAAALWFLFAGGLLVLLGLHVRRAEALGVTPSASFGAGLAVLAIAAGVAMPASGVWLLLPIAALVIARARRRSRA